MGEILKKILSYNKNDQELLQKCAIHISIIGAGNKNFGSIRHNEEVLNIEDIFLKLKINYKNIINQNLKEDEITPRRLVRIYRYHIQKFIETTGRPSYLFLKYSKRSVGAEIICFPGAEHLITNMNDFIYLMDTYKILDQRLGTTFCQRLERVGIARGIIIPN